MNKTFFILHTEAWLKEKKEIEARNAKSKSILSDMSQVEPDWESQESEMPPEYDLSDKNISLALIKTCKIGGLPQSVTRPFQKGDDFTLVSDVEGNRILKFKGWDDKGKDKCIFYTFTFPNCQSNLIIQCFAF